MKYVSQPHSTVSRHVSRTQLGGTTTTDLPGSQEPGKSVSALPSDASPRACPPVLPPASPRGQLPAPCVCCVLAGAGPLPPCHPGCPCAYCRPVTDCVSHVPWTPSLRKLLDTVLCNAEQQHTLHYCLLLFSCVDTLRTESCEACSLLSFKVGLLNRIHVCQSSKGRYHQ